MVAVSLFRSVSRKFMLRAEPKQLYMVMDRLNGGGEIQFDIGGIRHKFAFAGAFCLKDGRAQKI